MKDKIVQLEVLLNEITKLFVRRLRVKHTSYKYLETQFSELEEAYFALNPEKNQDIFYKIKEDIISSIMSEKEDTSFLENEIPQIKLLLANTLHSLEETIYFPEGGNSNLIPNEDFKNLIKKGILVPETLIVGKFKGKTVTGHLTEDGFFEMAINGTTISFSNFKNATLYAWNKVVQNDCWQVWTAIDKNGNSYPLKHYRDLLRKMS